MREEGWLNFEEQIGLEPKIYSGCKFVAAPNFEADVEGRRAVAESFG